MTRVMREDEMRDWAVDLGRLLRGGDVLELRGDVGSGKTSLTKGLAVGMGVDEDVQSPSFTISRVYDAPSGLRLAHYDFYRLTDAGIMTDELRETVADDRTVTVVEWGGLVEGVLPTDRLTIEFVAPTDDARELTIVANGPASQRIMEALV